jgi:hypothetical protein
MTGPVVAVADSEDDDRDQSDKRNNGEATHVPTVISHEATYQACGTLACVRFRRLKNARRVMFSGASAGREERSVDRGKASKRE